MGVLRGRVQDAVAAVGPTILQVPLLKGQSSATAGSSMRPMLAFSNAKSYSCDGTTVRRARMIAAATVREGFGQCLSHGTDCLEAVDGIAHFVAQDIGHR